MLKRLIKWQHFYYILFLVIFSLMILGPILNLNNSYRDSDWRNGDTPGYFFIKHYIIDQKSFPLWDHYTFSGRPAFSFGMPLLYPFSIGLSLFFYPVAVLNLMMMLHVLLAVISMYFLANYLIKNKKAALISSLIYGFSPYLVKTLVHPFWLYGLAFIPLELLLAIKTFKSKDFIKSSIILGIVFALHFLSAGILQWYYAVLFVSAYFIFKIFDKHFVNRATKSFVILFLFIIVMFSLISIRFLPGQEFTNFTNRGVGLPIEEILRVGHVEPSEFLDTFIYPFNPNTKSGSKKYGQIGLAGLALMIFAIYSFFKKKDFNKNEKRVVLFLLISMLGIVIFSTGIFLKLLYNFPGISSQRGVDRSLIIYILCASLLAGYGFNYWFDYMKLKIYPNKKINLIFFSTLFLVLSSLLLINWQGMSYHYNAFEHYSITESNELFQKMAEDDDIFRFHVIEVVGIDWNNFLGASIPLELESVYGTYGGGWDQRYFNQFLGASFRSPAKIWGMLNVKYIVSSKEINDSDYNLVKKFDNLPDETISTLSYNSTGYLYENKKNLPRAFIVPFSILSVGQEVASTQLIYALMLNNEFNPSNAVIIQGKERINDYKLSELIKYDAVFLSQGSIDQDTSSILNKYKDAGGKIFPDVTDGKNSLSELDIANFLSELNNLEKTSSKVDIASYYNETPNYMKIKVDTLKDTFLFVSEKYTLYPGWTAKVDGVETDIFLANGVLSAIYLPAGSKEVEFRYSPNSFKKGLIITTLSFFILMIYFLWPSIIKVKKKLKFNKSYKLLFLLF